MKKIPKILFNFGKSSGSKTISTTITMAQNSMPENWYPSIWGKNDELGALNHISPNKIVEASRLVKSGKIYNLGQLLEYGISVHSYHGQFLYSTFRRHADAIRLFNLKNKFGAMNVRLEMADHTGTHIDGLNHVSINDKLYNGRVTTEITGTFGTSELGMEKTPAVFTRGILIDVASLLGVSRLDKSHLISISEIQTCLEKSKLEIAKGDVVLLRTGWSQLWMKNNEEYSEHCPGIGMAAGQWLCEKGAALIGADNWLVERADPEQPGESFSVHQYLITKQGIRLIENMQLENLAEDGISEFLFVCLPLQIKGATGSTIRPIAII
jgi:kynurenine formamidase